MKYQCHEMNGTLADEGTIGSKEPDVPTHGSISLEMADGRWLTLQTSEWINVYLDAVPVTWPVSHERAMKANE